MIRLLHAGDSLALIELGTHLDAGLNARAVALAREIAALRLPGVWDVVPGMVSVGVHLDPRVTSLERLREPVFSALERASHQPAAHARTLDIPVVYGGTAGPDLAELATWAGLSEGDVIDRHCGREYRVYMLGFVPGFAYLGEVDPAIAAPRRSRPRPRVRAGSVAIAGRQTGVYALDTPGGWHVIGHTGIELYRPAVAGTPLLVAGDTVRFVAVAPG